MPEEPQQLVLEVPGIMEAEVLDITAVEVIIEAIVYDFGALVAWAVVHSFGALAAWVVAANDLASDVANSAVNLIHCVHLLEKSAARSYAFCEN